MLVKADEIRLASGAEWRIPSCLRHTLIMRLAPFMLILAASLLLIPSASAASIDLTIGKPVPSLDRADPLTDLSYSRSDGSASQAELYFPAQLLSDGNRLLFSEYNSVLKPRYYKLGGAIRSLDAEGNVKTLALSKRMARSADRMVGLAAADGTAYATLGESIVALPLPGADSTAERMFGFPSHGSIRESLSAYVLGSKELPYETLAGSAQTWGNVDGIGQKARFAYPTAISLWNDNLLVSDRDNNSLRRVDINSGATTTILTQIRQPLGMTMIGDMLYVANANDIKSFNVSECAAAAWQQCKTQSIKLKGGASAITNDGQSLYAASRRGVFSISPEDGRITRLMQQSSKLDALGGAAWWEGHLYLSDYRRRVIYRVSMNDTPAPARSAPPKPVASIIDQTTADGVLLSGQITPARSARYSWKISAPGCETIRQPQQKMLVACAIPTQGSAALTARFAGAAPIVVSRTLSFR